MRPPSQSTEDQNNLTGSKCAWGNAGAVGSKDPIAELCFRIFGRKWNEGMEITGILHGMTQSLVKIMSGGSQHGNFYKEAHQMEFMRLPVNVYQGFVVNNGPGFYKVVATLWSQHKKYKVEISIYFCWWICWVSLTGPIISLIGEGDSERVEGIWIKSGPHLNIEQRRNEHLSPQCLCAIWCQVKLIASVFMCSTSLHSLHTHVLI